MNYKETGIAEISPQRPRIEYNASQVLPGHNLTALHGEVATIKCVSHYGNPPPVLKWFLDQNEITPSRRQTNSTELDNPRTWMAISVLELTISKENHGRTLRCVAVHESYSTKSSSIEVRLDVMYVPETRLVGIPTIDVEELKDTVAVRCMVNSNPRASVTWRREGQSVAASFQELLQFSPVVRQHAGLYTCHARNQAGESPPLRFHLDVKYPPKILSVGPDRLTTAPLFTSATFECIGEGNPQPTYQWLQRYPTRSDFIIERGRESKLHVSNVTYDFQGEYVCKVTNIIGGTERTVQSEAIALQVVGAPQVLRHSIKPEIRVEKGENANLRVVVCADPRPRVMAWEWGSVRMEAGSEKGRFKVDDVTEEDREDCYSAALHILNAESVDSRAYYLAVENDKGKDKHAVLLHVNEPMQLKTLLSLAGGALAAFLLLICACIYAIKTEKCCFSRKGDFKPTDLDSEKLEIEKNSTGPGGIPADAIYTTTPRGGRGHHSPEAMKPTTHTFKGRSSLEDHPTEENVYSGVNSTIRQYRSQTVPKNYFESDDIENGLKFRHGDGKYHSYHKYYSIRKPTDIDDGENFSSFNTMTARSHRSSLPTDSKYDRRSSLQNNSKKYCKNKSRPKPLQFGEHEQYYNHIFPINPKNSNRNTDLYFQPSTLDRAEL
ncbi:hypothetical protein FQR65_LT11784 [Abscondita terminalis]|nr:hypothetical protein FQR65_LT11784 [Abscondita terminalis]